MNKPNNSLPMPTPEELAICEVRLTPQQAAALSKWVISQGDYSLHSRQCDGR